MRLSEKRRDAFSSKPREAREHAFHIGITVDITRL